ncbi:MAG TPA: hypothetical protein VHE34_08465, partial [Puia sp.]|nr:hypothetical protein [Puia sp.]
PPHSGGARSANIGPTRLRSNRYSSRGLPTRNRTAERPIDAHARLAPGIAAAAPEGGTGCFATWRGR